MPVGVSEVKVTKHVHRRDPARSAQKGFVQHDTCPRLQIKTASVRESILEVVCEVVKRIQTNDVATIVSDMEEIEMQVLDAEATNMKVAWLRAHLEAIQKRNATQTKSTLIVKTKANTTLVKRAAKLDLEERRTEIVTAQERFDKAEKCVKVLDLVEMKLNDNFVESQAEKDLWPEQAIL
nr:phospholipase-like protein [Tanacetum cinerariifolium]